LPKLSYLCSDGNYDAARRLAMLVRAAANRGKSLQDLLDSNSAKRSKAQSAYNIAKLNKSKLSLMAIGASTGGPNAIKVILSKLNGDFPLPIIVAQHMSSGVMHGLVQWLNSQIALKACIAENDIVPEAGKVYFPPSDMNLSVSFNGRLQLHKHDGVGPCPSVDHLFSSIARVYGARAIFLLLTGMGADGAQGLFEAYKKNGVTAVQDEASSVIFGMPKEALSLCPEHAILRLEEIAFWALNVVNERSA